MSRPETYEPYTPEPEREYEPIHPRSAWRDLAKKLWAPLGLLVALLVKFKGVALAVLKLKVFATSASMLVSMAAYAWIWGWKFAAGFVLLLLVHELGHVLELRRQGVPASAPLFIPFLGAVVGMKQMPADAWKEARVALAGPLLGTLGALVVWGAAEVAGSELLLALAFTGFFLNLFNLIPVSPLDGGRAVAAVHPAMWGLGLVLLAALTLLWPNPVALLILVVGGLEVWRRWRQRREPEAAAYYRVETWQRAVVGATYLGLAAFLLAAMAATFIERGF